MGSNSQLALPRADIKIIQLISIQLIVWMYPGLLVNCNCMGRIT
jgi:hypothetical protein